MQRKLSEEIILYTNQDEMRENFDFHGFDTIVEFKNATAEPAEVIKPIHVRMSNEYVSDRLQTRDEITKEIAAKVALDVVEERFHLQKDQVLDEDMLICANHLGGIKPLHLRELGRDGD